LDRFAEARAAEGVRVVILLIPQLRELASRGPGVVAEKAPRALAWAAKHPNVEVIDAYPALLERMDPVRHRIYYGDNHPNAQGHQLIAEALFDDLLAILEAPTP
ncbi:MAG: hypothetical protein AAF560_30440, partial [Acidobacteriota bacterium]